MGLVAVSVTRPSAPDRAAGELLESLWFGHPGTLARFPVDPVIIARRLGVNVYLAPMENGLSGVLAKTEPDAEPNMYLNAGDAQVRRRFTAGHELGHLDTVDLASNPAATFYFRRDQLASCGTDAEERYANQYSAALLMPADEVERLHRAGYTTAMMVRHFYVSEHSLGLRLKNLGLAG